MTSTLCILEKSLKVTVLVGIEKSECPSGEERDPIMTSGLEDRLDPNDGTFKRVPTTRRGDSEKFIP